jgi:hypothetical protein
MRKTLRLVVILLLLPATSFSQAASPAEKLRDGERYRNILSVFKEPQIFPSSNKSVEIYRVFIIPTFYHPLSIRVEREGNKYVLIAKRLSGQGGYGWGTLKREKRHYLTKNEWQHLRSLLNQASFWTLASDDKKNEPGEKGEATICLDGTTWLLEGVSEGKHHVVDRYCPDSKSFAAVGMYLARMSRLGIKKSDL